MSLVALMALSILAAEPAMEPPVTPDPPAATRETEDIPPGAPSDDYGFVNWCYGATDEYGYKAVENKANADQTHVENPRVEAAGAQGARQTHGIAIRARHGGGGAGRVRA